MREINSAKPHKTFSPHIMHEHVGVNVIEFCDFSKI